MGQASKKFSGLLKLSLLALGGAVLHRTVTFKSQQTTGIKAASISPRDLEASAQHLSKVLAFPTVSSRDMSKIDVNAFKGLHDYLATAFPLISQNLQRETVGLSLLYKWQGKDPSLAPVIFIGHLDVVPVIPETEKDWEHSPFSGDGAGNS